MTNRYVLVLILLLAASLFFVSSRVTYSLYSSLANNSSNVFSASTTFPTHVPTLTNTPTPSNTPTPTFTPTPTTSISAGDVVINEINWMGNNTTSTDEWVELRNMSSHSIDLSGWQIENLGVGSSGIITIPSGTIPASGFFLISNLDKATSRINVDPDYVTTSVSLVDTGEQLKLKTPGGTIIDTANGMGAWIAGSSGTPKKSMERKDPPEDGTSNGKWKTSVSHTGMDGSSTTDEFGSPKNSN